MKTSLIVKLNFLLLGLAVTLYFIYHLNSKGLNPSVKALFGVQSTVNSKNNQFKWNWCETRVAGVIVPEKFKVAQEGSFWIFENNAKKILNFIAVEKWLADSCAVDAQASEAKAQAGFLPALIIKYVDGKVEILKKNAQGLFMWRDQVFKSPEFEKAMSNLGELPAAVPASGAAK